MKHCFETDPRTRTMSSAGMTANCYSEQGAVSAAVRTTVRNKETTDCNIALHSYKC